MKGALSTLVLLYSVWAGRAWAEERVQIPDPVLKAAIERELWLSNPTPTDMLALTELTSIQDWEDWGDGISDLTGLDYAIHLQTLNLRLNQIRDISALSDMKDLSSLDLSQNFVIDVSPLSGLHNLTYVNIHENSIGDISPLSGLSNLRTLVLRGNVIRELSPLSATADLQDLDLRSNDICDIAPLSSLSGLSSLILSNNHISDISGLSALPRLRFLDLNMNSITDISPLCGMTALSHLDIRNNPLPETAYLFDIPHIIANNPNVSIEHDNHAGRYLIVSSTIGGSVTSPGEGLFTCEHNDFVRLTAKADPGFIFAGWTGVLETMDNPVSLVVNSDGTMLAHFLCLRETLHVGNAAAGNLCAADSAGCKPEADGSPEHPIESIQDAIDVAGKSATVLVQAGVYRENINLRGKKIHLVAVDPANPRGGPCAIIEGTGDGPVVMIGSGAGAECSLSGFVIMKGHGNPAGGIYCCGSRPTLSNCLIVGNRCSDPNGAAVYFYESQAVLINCTIADNCPGPDGAGLMLEDSDVTILNSIVWNNGPAEIRLRGDCAPSIRYCCIRGWWPDVGNTYADPLFVRPGAWVNGEDSSVVMAPTDPRAVWVDGDYHLKSRAGRWDTILGTWLTDGVSSPCIDAGDPEGLVGFEPSPNGGRINMGAYGGTAEASKSN